jgi:hypothetical protein
MTEHAVGKGTLVKQQPARASADIEATPGKQTLVDTSGAQSQAGGFHLTPSERAQTETVFVARVDAALTSFVGALSQVYSDNKAELRARAAELGPIAALIVAVAGTGASLAIKAFAPALVVKALMQVGISKHPPEVPEAALELLVGPPVDVAKDAGKSLAAPAVDDRGTGFLDSLAASASARFQQIRERPLRTATDAELAALVAAYDSSLHTLGRYRELIAQQLERFLASRASQIGRDFNVETRVAYVGDRLAYVEQKFSKVDATLVQHRKPYNDESALSLGDKTTPDAWDRGISQNVDHAEPSSRVYFVGFVEPDMREAALAQHEARWQAEPEHYDWSIITGGAK